MRTDGVGETAAAPRADLDDLAAGADDRSRRTVDGRLDPILSEVGSQDEHEFVTAHGAVALLPSGKPCSAG